MTTLSSRPCLVSAMTLNDETVSVWLLTSSVTLTAPAASAAASACPSACRRPETGIVTRSGAPSVPSTWASATLL